MNKLVIPYDETFGNPNSVFSEPYKPGQPQFNRANEISQLKDTARNISIGIKDIDESNNPDAKDVYTWWDVKTRSREKNVGWRIDYFFTSSELISKIKNTGMLSDYYGSDHCPIYIDL